MSLGSGIRNLRKMPKEQTKIRLGGNARVGPGRKWTAKTLRMVPVWCHWSDEEQAFRLLLWKK